MLVVLLAAGTLALACAETATIAPSPPRPTPSPSPSSPYPRGIPHSSALANLALVQQLERARGRNTVLVYIDGFASLDGAVAPGAGWAYSFADPTVPAARQLYPWGMR